MYALRIHICHGCTQVSWSPRSRYIDILINCTSSEIFIRGIENLFCCTYIYDIMKCDRAEICNHGFGLRWDPQGPTNTPMA